MKQPKRYDAGHPMVVKRSGDPARGLWRPWAGKDKSRKRGRRR